MKATPAQQSALLSLQQTDLAMSRLQHLDRTHPLREKLAELHGRADDLGRFVIGAGAEAGDLRRSIENIEAKITEVRERGETQQERLDSGKVGIRDMSAVEHEIAQINQRRDELEGTLLDEMEELESTEGRAAEAEAQQRVLLEDEAATELELEKELAEPRAELAKLESKRAKLRDELAGELLDEYDRLRGRLGPVVVLEISEGMLVNSPVMLPQEELDAVMVAPADQLLISEGEGYLLVRSS